MARQCQERQGATQPVSEGKALRCHCGSLLARLVPGGVELKCRRCKRTVVIALDPERQERAFDSV
jgi:phage FluMu protein Com